MDDETLIDGPNAEDEPSARQASGRAPGSKAAGTPNEGSAAFSAGSPANDLSGTTLGDYRLVRKIAEGGMGEVYEAIQLKLDRRVALKILTSRLATHPEFLRRFEREAKSAAALNHPGMVQVHDFGKAGDRYYLIMEYVEGQNLGDYIDEHGKLPHAEALGMIEQAAVALKAACEKNIIHRDIKPDNLLLTKDGRIKVSDLGLAKNVTEELELTVTGAAMGSPHFLAPEQAEDAARVDHRADIYSLGITLLYLLTGRHSYEGTSAFALVLAHSNKPLPTGKDLGTELPSAIETLIQRMAAKRPDDRYQDYDSLLADLARVKAGAAPALGPIRKPGLGRTPLLVGAAAVLIIAGLVVFLWPPPENHLQSGTASSSPPRPTENGPPDDPLRRPGPGGKQFPGGRGPKSGNPTRAADGHRLALPMPRFPDPDHNPIPDGPVDQMLAVADAYAKANTNEYVRIIDRYVQVWNKASGSALEPAVELKFNNAVELHQQAVKVTMEEYQNKMREFLRTGNSKEAYDVWKTFPARLRTPEVDEDIQGILERELPSK